jgi:hypothetical protein
MATISLTTFHHPDGRRPPWRSWRLISVAVLTLLMASFSKNYLVIPGQPPQVADLQIDEDSVSILSS